MLARHALRADLLRIGEHEDALEMAHQDFVVVMTGDGPGRGLVHDVTIPGFLRLLRRDMLEVLRLEPRDQNDDQQAESGGWAQNLGKEWGSSSCGGWARLMAASRFQAIFDPVTQGILERLRSLA